MVVVVVVVVAVGHSSGPELRGPNLGNFRGPSSSSSRVVVVVVVVVT